MAKAKEYIRLEFPDKWKSLVNGNEYLYSEYSNIDAPKNGYLALPKEGYPYKLLYRKNEKLSHLSLLVQK